MNVKWDVRGYFIVGVDGASGKLWENFN